MYTWLATMLPLPTATCTVWWCLSSTNQMCTHEHVRWLYMYVVVILQYVVCHIYLIILQPSGRMTMHCVGEKRRRLTSVLSFLLCWTATVLEGHFGEYHSSSAALGQQRPEVTKQPPVCDWLETPEALMMLNRHFARNTKGDSCRGE